MHGRQGMEEDGFQLNYLTVGRSFFGVPLLHRILVATKGSWHEAPSLGTLLLARHNPWSEVVAEMPSGHFCHPLPPMLVGHQHGGLLVGAGKLPTQHCVESKPTTLRSHGDIHDWGRVMPAVGKMPTNASQIHHSSSYGRAMGTPGVHHGLIMARSQATRKPLHRR